MAVNLSPIWGAGAQLLDNSGNVLTGGKIYTYAAGTTTPATTYTSSNGITANSNPIILNSAGRVPYEIWLTDGVVYKFVLKDSNDTLIATYDNLVGINSNYIAFTMQQEIQTATAGQTVFNLSTIQYQPGTNSLAVYVDGVNQYGPGAQYAYVETDSDTVTFISGLHVGASVKFTTAASVSSNYADAANVTYDPPFTGSVATNVEAKLAQTISVKDFGAVGDGVTDDSGAFNQAIDYISTAGGGTLYVPAGTYTISSKIYKYVSNITIIGDGMPWYNGGNTALVGGTIIQGKVHLIGDNIAVESLGIDCGTDVCNAINGGAYMDALVLMDPSRAIRYNCTVRDVITLCKEPTSACHNFLFEGLSDSRFENLHAKNAQWGVVLKTQKSTADGLYAYSCSQAGLTIKSDTGVAGSPANKTSVSNVHINNDGYPAAENCILIYAATEDLYSCTLTNFTTKNGVRGLKLLCDSKTSANNLINNIAISNGVIEYASTYGFESFGASYNVAVSNLVIQQTQSNKSVKVWSDCLGISLDNIYVSALDTADPLNVDLNGRFYFDNITSIVGGDYTQPSGINLIPDGNNRLLMSVGNYRGTLYLASVAPNVTLTNGWTEFFSTVTIEAKNGFANLRGRVAVPTTPWTGKEQIGTIPANLAPYSTKWFMANAWNSANSATVPVYIEISQSGVITANYLNTATAFPTTINWVSLDGLQWNMNE